MALNEQPYIASMTLLKSIDLSYMHADHCDLDVLFLEHSMVLSLYFQPSEVTK